MNRDQPGSIILPMGYFYLYYVLGNQNGSLPLAVAARSEDGYSGSITDLPTELQVSIVIKSTGFMMPDNVDKIIAREQPLKLKLVALDEDGYADWSVTRELYEAAFKYLNPPDSDDDDSWMYRSRPMIWPYY